MRTLAPLDAVLDLFRAPSGRAETEELLQFANSKLQQTTDIVIGFDFGTSCTKVVIQSPFKLNARSVAVDFLEDGHPSARQLVATALFLDSRGQHFLREVEGCVSARRDLKVRIFSDGQRAESSDDVNRASIYVGLVLRAARRFFFKTQGRFYRHDRLRWGMNLGVPSAGYDDDAIRARFSRVARAGWLLSLGSEPPTLRDSEAAVEKASAQGAVGIEVAVVPEVAAEVVGYAKSRFRREGLHLILDIGASTMDLCAFVLSEQQGDDLFALLTADVKPLGLLALHDERMTIFERRPPFNTWPADFLGPLPDWKGVAGLNSELSSRLVRSDEAYVDTCARQVLLKTLHDVRRKRDPLSRRWKEGLPVFVSGGGARASEVTKILELAESIGRRNWDPFRGLQTEALPLPEELTKELPAELHRRFAVAYGLSFPPINIGEIEPPSAIEDAPRHQPMADWRSRFISKDGV